MPNLFAAEGLTDASENKICGGGRFRITARYGLSWLRGNAHRISASPAHYVYERGVWCEHSGRCILRIFCTIGGLGAAGRAARV
jgi:hypothetical protein